MKNLKGFAVASDGNLKRIALTYDEINDSGKVINGNVKINRVVTDDGANEAISILEAYAQAMIDEED